MLPLLRFLYILPVGIHNNQEKGNGRLQGAAKGSEEGRRRKRRGKWRVERQKRGSEKKGRESITIWSRERGRLRFSETYLKSNSFSCLIISIDLPFPVTGTWFLDFDLFLFVINKRNKLELIIINCTKYTGR